MSGNIIEKFIKRRNATINLIKHLSEEDCLVQYDKDSSPIKWQLGHTTWFFEDFILCKYFKDYKYFNQNYLQLFNSYYENKGKKIKKIHRTNITRPYYNEVIEYRKYVDKNILKLLETPNPKIEFLVELGLNHEQQHQELILTDIKINLYFNPLKEFFKKLDVEKSESRDINYLKIDEGIYEIGVENENEFYFDIEQKKHKQYLVDFEIADRLITNREYLEFIKDNGYTNFNLWHSDGWDFINKNDVKLPLYWEEIDGEYFEYTLHNFQKIDLNAPVRHISFYEAFAFAKWYGGRLATEFEWEVAARKFKNKNTKLLDYNNLDSYLEPVSLNSRNDFIGNCWEWTNSAFLHYPGYKQDEGALGEYNGKFMVKRMVLRGGSSFTPKDHIRTSYRNFFYPSKRWQVSGIRIVK